MSDSDEKIHTDLSIAESEQDLPLEVKEKKLRGQLKTGYTTGTSATAASKSALITLLTGKTVKDVQVTLPKGKIVTIKIAWTKIHEKSITSAVIKDGGDDPDVTHGAEICSTVELTGSKGNVQIIGGTGVGKVTKPGLGLLLGNAAINPTPMKMISGAMHEVLGLYPDLIKNKGLKVIISVPSGAEIAKKTDNPRLGILGGISILGTTGIVLPYSTASFAAAIRQSLDVGIALKADTFILTTGGRSEDFCKSLFGDTYSDHCYVQMGDFAGYSVKQCHDKRVKKVFIAGFIGKLTKIAMGVKQTHVRGSHVDMGFMAKLAERTGASNDVLKLIRAANTARHVSEIIDSQNVKGFYDLICSNAASQLSNYSKNELSIEVIMFDFKGFIIGRFPKN
ncbi:MAG: cobalt-precorrin-5B (C(1))-methyltransferase [Candidatus Nitrosocosmicus sp.]|nr:cobalt-precorrin-5B (C(1))-methyltransferase [Candidatus Nitrosocosmicus sp.]MDN5866758.1 cobalt-precorrin-5B (C(1))-methyltransferase [Candidatus Nitrosocosmicus sp.]